jgi:hypothetical protein
MCGNGENMFGIIAGLVAAAAMLVMAYADKHGANAHAHAAHTVVAMSPVGVETHRENTRVVVTLRL